MKTVNEALARWHSYIDTLNWEKGWLDRSGWCAFLRARSLGVERATALATVADLIQRAGDSPRAYKLQSQFERAFAMAGKHAHKTLAEARENWIPRPPKPTFDPARARRLSQTEFQPALTLPGSKNIPPLLSMAYHPTSFWRNSTLQDNVS